MNTANSPALLRSLIVYAICVPLAILAGYMLTNPLDYQSIGFVGIFLAFLVFPLLMKWHYPLLIFSWSLPATLFFLPGHPSLFLLMSVVSLTISVVERILNRNQTFLPSTPVRWPLIFFLIVVFITASLTGGFGLRSMGSSTYGGKKYIVLIGGILSFFAITARPIPKKDANFYVTLYFVGAFFSCISDLYYYTPSWMKFVYLIFPPSSNEMDAMGNPSIVFGQTRLEGIGAAAGAIFYWMLARNGFRDNFLTNKLWRPPLLGVLFVLTMLGGFRSSIISLIFIIAIIFYLEKLHRSGVMLVVVLIAALGAVLLVPMARYLPFTFQRSLAFLPLDITPEARMNAEATTDWRLEMWEALLPEIPKYLILGKGYAFSSLTYNEVMGRSAMFDRTIDAAEDPLAVAGDFHSGPLSVVLSFGIWGVIAWLWYWGAGFFVVWRNYHYGDASVRHINLFLFAAFISKCMMFLFVFGDIVTDVGGFAGIIGLSIAINHGIMRRPRAARESAATAPSQVPFPVRPALSR